MLARRLLLLAAVLLLLTALAAGMAPEPEVAAPPAGAAAVPAGTIVEKRLSATGSGAGQTVRAEIGDLIRIEIAGDLLDEVQIERLDRFDSIEPTTPARFEVLAEEPGVYPIRLVEADRRIGRLDIRP